MMLKIRRKSFVISCLTITLFFALGVWHLFTNFGQLVLAKPREHRYGLVRTLQRGFSESKIWRRNSDTNSTLDHRLPKRAKIEDKDLHDLQERLRRYYWEAVGKGKALRLQRELLDIHHFRREDNSIPTEVESIMDSQDQHGEFYWEDYPAPSLSESIAEAENNDDFFDLLTKIRFQASDWAFTAGTSHLDDGEATGSALPLTFGVATDFKHIIIRMEPPLHRDTSMFIFSCWNAALAHEDKISRGPPHHHVTISLYRITNAETIGTLVLIQDDMESAYPGQRTQKFVKLQRNLLEKDNLIESWDAALGTAEISEITVMLSRAPNAFSRSDISKIYFSLEEYNGGNYPEVANIILILEQGSQKHPAVSKACENAQRPQTELAPGTGFFFERLKVQDQSTTSHPGFESLSRTSWGKEFPEGTSSSYQHYRMTIKEPRGNWMYHVALSPTENHFVMVEFNSENSKHPNPNLGWMIDSAWCAEFPDTSISELSFLNIPRERFRFTDEMGSKLEDDEIVFFDENNKGWSQEGEGDEELAIWDFLAFRGGNWLRTPNERLSALTSLEVQRNKRASSSVYSIITRIGANFEMPLSIESQNRWFGGAQSGLKYLAHLRVYQWREEEELDQVAIRKKSAVRGMNQMLKNPLSEVYENDLLLEEVFKQFSERTKETISKVNQNDNTKSKRLRYRGMDMVVRKSGFRIAFSLEDYHIVVTDVVSTAGMSEIRDAIITAGNGLFEDVSNVQTISFTELTPNSQKVASEILASRIQDVDMRPGRGSIFLSDILTDAVEKREVLSSGDLNNLWDYLALMGMIEIEAVNRIFFEHKSAFNGLHIKEIYLHWGIGNDKKLAPRLLIWLGTATEKSSRLFYQGDEREKGEVSLLSDPSLEPSSIMGFYLWYRCWFRFLGDMNARGRDNLALSLAIDQAFTTTRVNVIFGCPGEILKVLGLFRTFDIKIEQNSGVYDRFLFQNDKDQADKHSESESGYEILVSVAEEDGHLILASFAGVGDSESVAHIRELSGVFQAAWNKIHELKAPARNEDQMSDLEEEKQDTTLRYVTIHQLCKETIAVLQRIVQTAGTDEETYKFTVTVPSFSEDSSEDIKDGVVITLMGLREVAAVATLLFESPSLAGNRRICHIGISLNSEMERFEGRYGTKSDKNPNIVIKTCDMNN